MAELGTESLKGTLKMDGMGPRQKVPKLMKFRALPSSGFQRNKRLFGQA
jgi:hypothetical protein